MAEGRNDSSGSCRFAPQYFDLSQAKKDLFGPPVTHSLLISFTALNLHAVPRKLPLRVDPHRTEHSLPAPGYFLNQRQDALFVGYPQKQPLFYERHLVVIVRAAKHNTIGAYHIRRIDRSLLLAITPDAESCRQVSGRCLNVHMFLLRPPRDEHGLCLRPALH
jgi:hypothetical protein